MRLETFGMWVGLHLVLRAGSCIRIQALDAVIGEYTTTIVSMLFVALNG
jgi:hypothetical protein